MNTDSSCIFCKKKTNFTTIIIGLRRISFRYEKEKFKPWTLYDTSFHYPLKTDSIRGVSVVYTNECKSCNSFQFFVDKTSHSFSVFKEKYAGCLLCLPSQDKVCCECKTPLKLVYATMSVLRRLDKIGKLRLYWAPLFKEKPKTFLGMFKCLGKRGYIPVFLCLNCGNLYTKPNAEIEYATDVL
jgi:hypothetical protein